MFAMQTTRRIIWHLAAWLALVFSTLATCAPASANCSVTGHSAGTPHSCCKTHPDTCACPSTQSGSNHNARSGSCQLSDCSCNLVPGPESVPLPQRAAAELFYPAIVVAGLALMPMDILRRGPPITSADITSQRASLPPSSPRAPPFQG